MKPSARKKKTRTTVKPVNYFVCDCSKDKERSPAEMAEHLKVDHHLPDSKGSRKMLLHLDAADSYRSQYEWKFGDVVAYQFTFNPRKGTDVWV